MVNRMTKSEAYDILSERIRNACIGDVVYGIGATDKEDTYTTMISLLADLNATNETLDEILNRGEKRDN